MKTSFTTLGCPAWDLTRIIEQGSRLGFDGVDFRGLQDDLDITALPAFTSALQQTVTRFADAGLVVNGISTSLKVCDDTMADANLEEARRTIPVAMALGTETIRVFGGGHPDRHSKQEMADIGQQMMMRVLELDGASRFKWVFETHDHWISSADCALLLERVTVPEFGALWDVGHTSRVGVRGLGKARLGGLSETVTLRTRRSSRRSDGLAEGLAVVSRRPAPSGLDSR